MSVTTEPWRHCLRVAAAHVAPNWRPVASLLPTIHSWKREINSSSLPLVGGVDGRVSVDVGAVLGLEAVHAIALRSWRQSAAQLSCTADQQQPWGAMRTSQAKLCCSTQPGLDQRLHRRLNVPYLALAALRVDPALLVHEAGPALQVLLHNRVVDGLQADLGSEPKADSREASYLHTDLKWAAGTLHKAQQHKLPASEKGLVEGSSRVEVPLAQAHPAAPPHAGVPAHLANVNLATAGSNGLDGAARGPAQVGWASSIGLKRLLCDLGRAPQPCVAACIGRCGQEPWQDWQTAHPITPPAQRPPCGQGHARGERDLGYGGHCSSCCCCGGYLALHAHNPGVVEA